MAYDFAIGRDSRTRRFWGCLRAGLLTLVLAVAGDAAKSVADELAILVIETAAGEDISFRVELAQTADERSLGLMHRDRLDSDSGMLFLYPTERVVTMWMHQTRIPLDMLFIRGDGTIERIHERAVPYSEAIISSGEPVIAVLELNGGTASRYGIAPGDTVIMPEGAH